MALPYPCLCLVTDRTVCPPDELPQRVAAAVAGGVDLVQLRDKEQPGGALLEQVVALRSITQGRALLLVNERADVAKTGGADGVQLGEAAMPTAKVRAIIGPNTVIGRSVHSVAGALEAAAGGSDFLLVGTMFVTRSHPGEEPSGPGLLARIASAGVSIPMLGIGGITTDNVADVMAQGAYGAAVITGILANPDPETAARRLKSVMLDATAGDPRMKRESQPAVAPQLAGGVPPL